MNEKKLMVHVIGPSYPHNIYKNQHSKTGELTTYGLVYVPTWKTMCSSLFLSLPRHNQNIGIMCHYNYYFLKFWIICQKETSYLSCYSSLVKTDPLHVQVNTCQTPMFHFIMHSIARQPTPGGRPWYYVTFI